MTESTWALTGAVRCRNADTDDWNTYVPIPLDEAYAYLRWEYDEKTLSSMDAVYAYEPETDTTARLNVDYAGDGVYFLYRADGNCTAASRRPTKTAFFPKNNRKIYCITTQCVVYWVHQQKNIFLSRAAEGLAL